MHHSFFKNILLITEAFLVFITIQLFYFLLGNMSSITIGIFILCASVTLFISVFLKAYLKDKSSKKKLTKTAFELN